MPILRINKSSILVLYQWKVLKVIVMFNMKDMTLMDFLLNIAGRFISVLMKFI